MEYILCSAIKYGNTFVYGRRHGDCYSLLQSVLTETVKKSKGMTVLKSVIIANELEDPKNLPLREDQGFLTSTGRYVDRIEGWKIAVASGQVKDRKWSDEVYCEGLEAIHPDRPMILISEDLYYDCEIDD